MSITPGLSPHERAVWMVVRECTEKNGYCPSQREIAETTGFYLANVNRCVQALETKGYIRRQAGVMRSLIPVDPERAEQTALANNVRRQIGFLRKRLKVTDDVKELVRITDQIDNLLYRLEQWGSG